MIRFLLLLAALFLIALGFHWLKDASGEVSLTLSGATYAVDLTTAALGFLVAVAAALIFLMLFRALVQAPHWMAQGFRHRNAEKARAAVAHGLIAIASGDGRTADKAALEASRRAPGQPLTLLLQAQAAQIRGDRQAALRSFEAMAGEDETRVAGLRGLYIEAEREGNHEAARQIAEQARSASATAPWAARALLQHQSADADWDGALRTLASAADARIIDKRTARRQRAVLLTAKALANEDGSPDAARAAALEAHELAPDLVPAAVVAGRLLSRLGDIRRAAKALETTWKVAPHPEIAEAYAHVRAGDSALDRMKRMETLHRLRPLADEGRLALARAAIEARDFERAREVLTPVLTSRPTQNALFVMTDLVEAESGDHGLAREWLARAVRAPRDPAWTADGIVFEQWAPISPISGRIDAVEWKVPLAELAGPSLDIDEAALRRPETGGQVGPTSFAMEAESTPEQSQTIPPDDVPTSRPTAEAASSPAPVDAQPGIRGNGHGPEHGGDRTLNNDAASPIAPGDDWLVEDTPASGGPALPRPPDDPGVNDDAEEGTEPRARLF